MNGTPSQLKRALHWREVSLAPNGHSATIYPAKFKMEPTCLACLDHLSHGGGGGIGRAGAGNHFQGVGPGASAGTVHRPDL